MVIHEFGKENKKKLLFFQGSCEPWQEFKESAELLSDGFHVILVTPDGHDPEEGNDFISVEKTASDTAKWLKDHDINHLDALYGLSFGGGMAIHFLTSENIKVDKAILDAATAPYDLPKWLCKLICVRDYLMIKIGRSSVSLMEMAFPPERFARDINRTKEEYEAIKDYLKTFSDKTMWNIFWSANNYEVPEKAPEIDTKISFWIGDDEWKGRVRDLNWTKKYLPQIEVVNIPHMMHGELVMMHPQEFAKRAREFFLE